MGRGHPKQPETDEEHEDVGEQLEAVVGDEAHADELGLPETPDEEYEAHSDNTGDAGDPEPSPARVLGRAGPTV